jgi:microcystin degradation protein MlrC
LLIGDEAIAARSDANTELAGFLDAGRAHGWHVEHVLSASAGPSGKVERAAFERFCDPIVAAARQGRFDGILLGLHGAMVLDFREDGEGEILRRIRASAGGEIPIAITLDLHANVSRQMCSLADIIVSFRTYPHVDLRETGRRAGDILHRTLAGEIKPRTIRVSRPMLEETNGGRTDAGHSVFAKAFLDALNENKSVRDGQSLFDTIKRPIVVNADQTPQYSDIRRAGHDGGDFMFVRR